MLEKVIAIVAEGLGVEAGNLNAETTFESLGADSLDLMDMVMNFEDEFGIEISPKEAGKSVSELVQYIESKKA